MPWTQSTPGIRLRRSHRRLGSMALQSLRVEQEGTGEVIPLDIQIATWEARGILIVFAVIALAIFVRGSNWAWGVGGIIASAFAAMGIAGQAMGWVAGLLIAGVVLLVVSGLLLVARRRVEAREAPTSDPAR